MPVINCKNCGNKIECKAGKTTVYCSKCGCKNDINTDKPNFVLVNDKPPAQPKAKKSSKKLISIVAAALAVVITVTSIILITAKNKNPTAVETPGQGQSSISDSGKSGGFFKDFLKPNKGEPELNSTVLNSIATTVPLPGITNNLPGAKVTNKAPVKPTNPKKPSGGLSLTIAEANKRNGLIEAGDDITVGLQKNGTAVATQIMFTIDDNHNLTAVSTSGQTVIGLKNNGTVVPLYSVPEYQTIRNWKDIKAVSVAFEHIVGLKKNGTVAAIGNNDLKQCEVSGWKNIAAVSAARFHTVGLKNDGTVVSTKISNPNYNFDYGQTNVSAWKNIVAVSAGDYHTVGLKKDGTVVAVGSNDFGQCNVSGWKNIVAVDAGGRHTIGLKKDGTVVVAGADKQYCDISSWKNIVAVSAGNYHIAGLKKDGTVVATKIDFSDVVTGECDVYDWYGLKTP